MIAASRTFALLRGLRPWCATCAALAILLLTSTAFAALPLTGTFRGKVIGRLVTFTTPQQRTVTDWAGVLSLQLDRDRPGDSLGARIPVFCIEVNVAVRGGNRYKSDGSVTALHGGCQIRYLLDRYPASTATTADEAAARQLTIWHFSDDVDLTTVQDPAIQARATALANEAALAVALGGCPGSQTSVTSLTLDPPTATVVTGQVVNYTVRADPPGAAQSVEIAVSGSATLTNGQQQATLPLAQGVASFSIVNQVAGASTITARLPYALDAGTVFSPIDASRPTQRLVMGERVTLTASATVQAVWAPATATPASAPPVTDTPVSAPPVTDTPVSGPPITATPVSAPPVADTPTSAPPTSVPPTNIPPATPTHKPPSGSKPTPAPAPQTTPMATTTPPNGSSGPPAGGPPGGSTGPGGPQSPTPGGSGGPGSGGGPGGTPVGGESSAGGTGGTGGAAIPRPAQLPNTGDAGGATQLALALAALLIAGGALLRILRKRLA